MNRKWTAVFLSAGMAVAIGGLVQAQEDQLVAPVLAPQGAMRWRMTIQTDSKAGAAAQADVQNQLTYDIAKDGDIKSVVIKFGGADPTEFWWFKNNLLSHRYKSRKIDVTRVNSAGPEPYPYASDGFYGIQNVKLDDDRGMAAHNGSKCRFFSGKAPDPGWNMDGGNAATEITYEAWFDAKTGLPKEYRIRGRSFLFDFSSLTPGTLRLPEEYKAAWDENLENLRRSGLTP